VLGLPPVHGTQASTTALLYLYTVLGLPPVHGTHAHASTIGLV